MNRQTDGLDLDFLVLLMRVRLMRTKRRCSVRKGEIFLGHDVVVATGSLGFDSKKGINNLQRVLRPKDK